MRLAPPEIVERMAVFAARHGNDYLADRLAAGDLVLVWVDGKSGTELRAVSKHLASMLKTLAASPPTSLGEFWGTWKDDEWSPSLEGACRIGARKQTDRVIVNDTAAQLFLYGRDILGGSIIHHDDGLRRGMVAWVTDRHQNVLGLAEIVDNWNSRGPVMRPAIDLGWYLREGG